LREGLALAFPRFEAFLRVATRFFALAMAVSCKVCRRAMTQPTLSFNNWPRHFYRLPVGQTGNHAVNSRCLLLPRK
jgi:hypothetical protein